MTTEGPNEKLKMKEVREHITYLHGGREFQEDWKSPKGQEDRAGLVYPGNNHWASVDEVVWLRGSNRR